MIGMHKVTLFVLIALVCFVYPGAEGASAGTEAVDGKLRLAHTLLESGQLGSACALYWESAMLAQAIEYAQGLADALYGLGDCSRYSQEFTDAVRYYREALSIYLALNDLYYYARCSSDLATCYQELGMIELSVATWQTALEFFEQEIGVAGHEFEVAVIHNNLGRTFMEFLMRLDEALFHYEEASLLFLSIDHPLGVANSSVGLGGVCLWFGRYEEAIDYFREALPIYEGLNDLLKKADTHGRIGTCYKELGDYASATDAFLAAVDTYHEVQQQLRCTSVLVGLYPNPAAAHLCLTSKDGECSAFQGLCQASLGLGDVDAALGYARLALSYAEGLEVLYGTLFPFEVSALARPKLLKGWSLFQLGSCYMASRDYDAALQMYSDAVAEARAIPFLLGQARSLCGVGQLDEARRVYGEIIEEIEQAREQATTLESQRMDYMKLVQTCYQEYLDLLAHTDEAGPEILYLSEGARARSLLDILALGAQATIPRVEGLRVNGTVDSEEIRRLVADVPDCLDVNEVVVAFAWGEEHLFQWIVTAEDGIVGPNVFEVSYETFLADIYELRSLLEHFDPDATPLETALQKEEAGARLHTLYDLLLSSVEPYLEGKDTIVLVPSGPLWYVPFSALKPSSDDGSYLVRDFAVGYAPSLALVPVLIEAAGTSRDAQSLGLATPSRDGAAPLPPELATAVEAFLEAVGGGVFYEAGLATEAALKSEIPLRDADEISDDRIAANQYEYVAFACHGQYNHENPLYSRLVLGATEGEDGDVYAREILEMDLQGTTLVLLLACETFLVAVESRAGALGLPGSMERERKLEILRDLARGDEIVGLTRSFLLAGADGVLATQWEVSPRATARLATAFGESLAAGTHTAQALQAAQLQLLDHASFSEPWFWAPYQLVGRWR